MTLLLLLVIALPEDLIFRTEQDIDLELILTDLENLKMNPIDINQATVEELARVPYLSLNICIKIVEYRESRGAFRSLDDLLQISGIDRPLIDVLRPYLTVGVKRIKLENVAVRTRASTILPVEDRSVAYYTRSGLALDEYRLYAVTEKDPFESAFFDHYAAGLLVDEGIRKFALGKYNLDIGAGVVLSSIGSFFRGLDFRIMMNERGVIPYTSTIENGGFFGAAFTDSLYLTYTLFYSNQSLDGRVDSMGFARSFDNSGQHVDSLSLSRKDRIDEEIFGYDFRYRTQNMLISNRTLFCNYDPAFATTDSLENFFGQDFYISGLEFRYFGGSFVMFSELARSWKNHVGGLFGFSTAFASLDFTLAGRYFPPAFYSPKGIEAVANHAGGTLDLRHHSRIFEAGLNISLDNKIDEDTTKYDIRLSLSKRLGILDARMNLRRRYRAEENDISGSDILLRLSPVRFLFLDMRFEQRSVFQETMENGLFAAVELGLDLENYDARVRYGFFNTDSYAARVYAYEIDLPGIVNNRMLYGQGHYGFVYASIKPRPWMKLSAKYSAISRDDEQDRKLGAQVDCSF